MTKKEIMLLISGLEPSPIDEDIPDDDKEVAYCKGYNDALEDIMELIKRNHVEVVKKNDIYFEWNETIQKLYGGKND